MKVKFRNPPIHEVIIGAYFNPPLTAFRSEHMGLLWSRLRGDFPTVEQRAPMGNPEPSATEFFFMPRYWLLSEDEATLIQIQKDAFLFNWRRRGPEYPHFAETLKPKFDSYFRIFEEFLSEDIGLTHPEIGRCEITYVDMIEPSDHWKGWQDTSRVVPSFSVPVCASAQNAPPAFNCAYRYDAAPNVQLEVAIRSGQSSGQPSSPRLILEFKALSTSDTMSRADANAWYDQAHDVIVAQFLGMTSPSVQRELWGREEIK
ncbi:TIGR04255 family protein [Candidatus Foliamicus sp.]